jgi:hypothetical protein
MYPQRTERLTTDYVEYRQVKFLNLDVMYC